MPDTDEPTPERPDEDHDGRPAPVDPDAPGAGVDDDRSTEVPEPNEPA